MRNKKQRPEVVRGVHCSLSVGFTYFQRNPTSLRDEREHDL
jgi:hypothetical protein